MNYWNYSTIIIFRRLYRRTSDAGSGSESESEPYRVAPPPANYPDYNNINNNLNILDMDDDSIKIEARLEVRVSTGLNIQTEHLKRRYKKLTVNVVIV